MKTIKEWLEELPEPYRSEALENSEDWSWDNKQEVKSLATALDCAFIWSLSPQGQDYWMKLRKTL
jgi:hypothetical protein